MALTAAKSFRVAHNNNNNNSILNLWTSYSFKTIKSVKTNKTYIQCKKEWLIAEAPDCILTEIWASWILRQQDEKQQGEHCPLEWLWGTRLAMLQLFSSQSAFGSHKCKSRSTYKEPGGKTDWASTSWTQVGVIVS